MKGERTRKERREHGRSYEMRRTNLLAKKGGHIILDSVQRSKHEVEDEDVDSQRFVGQVAAQAAVALHPILQDPRRHVVATVATIEKGLSIV